MGGSMRFWAFKPVCLLFMLTLSSQAWALDPNVCKNPTKNGYLVQNVNSKDPISLVSHSDAVKIFNELKNPKYRIPYLNAADNCDARGHRIAQILQQRRLSTIKVFVETVNEEFYGAGAPSFTYDSFVDDGSRVVLSAKDILGHEHTWRYHTAPALCVRKDGKDELYMFDLSLFHEPVPYEVWKNKMTQGLSSEDYKVISTNMYSMTMQSEFSQAKTRFEKWETSMMEDELRQDWSGHQRFLNSARGQLRQSRSPSVPTVQ